MYNEVLTNSDHIEIIGEGAFESCISLETVTIITNALPSLHANAVLPKSTDSI